MAPKIGVLFDPAGTSTLELQAAITGMAELVWVIRDGQDGGRVPRALLERMGDVVDVASDELDAAAATLRLAGISGIVTFSDSHLILTAELADRLGLPGYPPDVAATVRNKFRQRQALRLAGVPQPDFWHLPAGLSSSEVRRIAADVPYPALVKPTEAAGSRGIVRVLSGTDLEAAYDPAVDQLVEEVMSPTQAWSDRYAAQVAVGSAVTDTGLSHAVIQGNFPTDGYRLTGRFTPAQIDETLQQQVLEVATEAIRALGIRNSMVDTELMITDSGPKVIEVNGRLSGASPSCLRLASDVDLRRTAVQLALGLAVDFPTLVPTRGVGFLWDCNPPANARTVLSIRGTDDLAALDYVTSVQVQAGPGEQLNRGDGTFGVVHVLGRTADHRELLEATEKIQRTVVIEYGFDELADSAALATKGGS